MSNYILEIKNVTKTFPGVKALDNININVREGETHALCGENGAGKSTLINLLSGVYPYGSYEGEIYINGKLAKFSSIRDSEKEGIVCIHQELALAPDLSIAENIFMGRLPEKFSVVQPMLMNDRAKEYLEMVGLRDKERGINVEPEEIVSHLGVGQQQLVEIARALSKNAKILILDEPTSALTEKEVDILLNVIKSLKKQKVTCILISHKLDEVMSVSETASVIRDGQYIATKEIKDITQDDLVSLMVGRQLTNLYCREEHKPGELSLEIRDYRLYDPVVSDKVIVKNANIKAYKGEILGITGLIGSGRTELFSSIFGGFKGRHTGHVFLNGREVSFSNPRQAINHGYYYLPEDRKNYAIIPDLQVKENTTISSMKRVSRHGVIISSKEIEQAKTYNESLHTKTASIETLIKNLSGGNQQKVVIARALMSNPDILVLDEPTRGIDIGAKQEIYKIMNALVGQGVTVILISSEMEEVMGISDRIIVFGQGQIKGELRYGEYTQEKILSMGIA